MPAIGNEIEVDLLWMGKDLYLFWIVKWSCPKSCIVRQEFSAIDKRFAGACGIAVVVGLLQKFKDAARG